MLWKKHVSYHCQQSYHNSSVCHLVTQSLTMISSSYTKYVQIKIRAASCALLAEIYKLMRFDYQTYQIQSLKSNIWLIITALLPWTIKQRVNTVQLAVCTVYITHISSTSSTITWSIYHVSLRVSYVGKEHYASCAGVFLLLVCQMRFLNMSYFTIKWTSFLLILSKKGIVI